ncbi:uncharacterized protein [Amphiura filiformis]|uniref:uncharacterized protein isoform X2 n=1 Tax=Amphiura filiformis TaxID=82378 RepID=UPI003B2257EB
MCATILLLKMMHLRYPQKRDFYTWDELSCLSRALGFQPDTIQKCIPDEITETEEGISFKIVQKLIDLKYFNDALDVSINMHSADYNINSILKSLKLLNHRLLSFAELHDVRVAFQVYEAGDMRGMMIDQHILIRTLKLCGRTIAPLKLMHRVKHMQEDFDEPGRIQLYEFLDLIVLCEQAGDIDVPESKRGPLDKTWRKLFELDDFKHVCATNDEKLLNHLNHEFRNTELNYGHEQLGSKRIPREAAVDTSVRKTQVRFHGKRYKQLYNYLGQSTATVQYAKAGCIRERPVTVPGVDEFRFPAKSPIPQLQRSQTAAEDALSSIPFMEDPRIKLLQAIHDRKVLQSAPCGALSSPSPSPRVTFADPGRNIRTAPENSSRMGRPWQLQAPDASRPQTRAVVSEKDVLERQNILDSLQYEIETLEERRMQKLKEQIRQHLPRFNLDSINANNNTKAPGVTTKKPKQKRERQPSPEAIRRLSSSKSKVGQGSHSKNCDALAQAGTKRDGAERKSKAKKKSDKGTSLKPLLLLEGRRCSDATDSVIQEEPATNSVGTKDDLKDEKGNAVETASTLSSRTVASSVAKSYDLLPPTYHGRLRHHQIQPTKDPEKYKSARVGAAAVLYNHFNVGDRSASNQKQNVKHENRRGEGQSSNHIVGAFIVPSIRNSEDNQSMLNKSNDIAKVHSTKASEQALKVREVPNSASSVDDELRINGMTLSEMVKSTSNKEDDRDGDLWR